MPNNALPDQTNIYATLSYPIPDPEQFAQIAGLRPHNGFIVMQGRLSHSKLLWSSKIKHVESFTRKA
jgi:hypothetical protein